MMDGALGLKSPLAQNACLRKLTIAVGSWTTNRAVMQCQPSGTVGTIYPDYAQPAVMACFGVCHETQPKKHATFGQMRSTTPLRAANVAAR